MTMPGVKLFQNRLNKFWKRIESIGHTFNLSKAQEFQMGAVFPVSGVCVLKSLVKSIGWKFGSFFAF